MKHSPNLSGEKSCWRRSGSGSVAVVVVSPPALPPTSPFTPQHRTGLRADATQKRHAFRSAAEVWRSVTKRRLSLMIPACWRSPFPDLPDIITKIKNIVQEETYHEFQKAKHSPFTWSDGGGGLLQRNAVLGLIKWPLFLTLWYSEATQAQRRSVIKQMDGCC